MINFNVPPFIGTEMDYIKKQLKIKKFVEMESLLKSVTHGLRKRRKQLKHFSQHHVHMQLRWLPFLCDIKEGDEVIMPSYTFVSTADAFVLRGATVVLWILIRKL